MKKVWILDHGPQNLGIAGNLEVEGNLKVNGTTTLVGDVSATNIKVLAKLEAVEVEADVITSDSAVIGDTLDVLGKTTLDGVLEAKKAATFDTTVVVGGQTSTNSLVVTDLGVIGEVSTDKLDVFGSSNFNDAGFLGDVEFLNQVESVYPIDRKSVV